MKLLVVEDDEVSRKIMMKTLCQFGDCVVSVSGKEALVEFKHAYDMGVPFDLICLDISLPDMSGIDVLRMIRNIEKEMGINRVKGVRVVMVTASSDPNCVIGSVQAGCDNYIVKPFDRTLVIEKLKNLGFSPQSQKDA